MLKNQLLCCSALLFSSFAQAAILNVHGVGGVALTSMNGNTFLNLGQVTNQFNTTSGTKTSGVWGVGAGYEKALMLRQMPFIVNVDFTAYHTQSTLSGIETPGVNVIQQAATLNYSANMNNWAYMFEPKLISKQFSFEPFFMFGLGFSNNTTGDYQETPSNVNSSAVTTNYFAQNTNTQFAWEVGAGVQHTLVQLPKGGELRIAGEYRYMDWGSMILGKTAAQTTSNGPNFGHYTSNVFDVRLSLFY